MTIDERFRADLRAALDDAAGGVAPLDAAALVATGGRTVRRRRLTAATVAVAIALVGALAVLPGLGQRLATPIAPPTGRGVTLTLPLTTATGTPDTTFTVTALPDGTVEYAAVRDGLPVHLGGSSLAGLDGQATLTTAGDDIVLGLFPTRPSAPVCSRRRPRAASPAPSRTRYLCPARATPPSASAWRTHPRRGRTTSSPSGGARTGRRSPTPRPAPAWCSPRPRSRCGTCPAMVSSARERPRRASPPS